MNQVDFNAGVVAAGEAQIESTVTGNEPGTPLDLTWRISLELHFHTKLKSLDPKPYTVPRRDSKTDEMEACRFVF